jgi:hypothetical protein
MAPVMAQPPGPSSCKALLRQLGRIAIYTACFRLQIGYRQATLVFPTWIAGGGLRQIKARLAGLPILAAKRNHRSLASPVPYGGQ